MKNLFTFLFSRSTAAAGLHSPLTSVNLPMPPVKPARQSWEDEWDRITERWPVGTTMTWIGAKMHVVGIQVYRPACYGDRFPGLPPQEAGYCMEYADSNGVIREHFMPAKAAIAYFKQ